MCGEFDFSVISHAPGGHHTKRRSLIRIPDETGVLIQFTLCALLPAVGYVVSSRLCVRKIRCWRWIGVRCKDKGDVTRGTAGHMGVDVVKGTSADGSKWSEH